MSKNWETAKFVNINGKYIPFTNEQDLIKIQDREIERLNDIINELEKYIEFYVSGNLKYDEKTTQVIWNKLKSLKEGTTNETNN